MQVRQTCRRIVRPPLQGGLPDSVRRVLEIGEEHGIRAGPPPQLVQGRDVLPYYGGKSGPHIGAAVAAAYEAYLKGDFTTREEAQKWLKRYLAGKARIIRGRDVLPYFGRTCLEIGKVVDAAWEAQTAGEFMDRAGAEKWPKRYFGS